MRRMSRTSRTLHSSSLAISSGVGSRPSCWTSWRSTWTLIALSLGFIIGGAITIEYVFDYPGIGLAIVDAIDKRDYAFLQGAFLVLTLSVILFNFIADLLYFKLDPRVTA